MALALLFALSLLVLPAPALVPLQSGPYLPPEDDPSVPPELKGVVNHPGMGPLLAFSPTRWEWWFEFNQEGLLTLRERLPTRALQTGAAWQPLGDDDRGSLVLPVLVDALRDRPFTEPGLRRRFNTRDVRAAAVLALGRLQRSDAVPYIELVLENDPELFVRIQAVLALGFSGSSQAVETLARLFRDEDESVEVRTYAVAGLGLIASPEALDVLQQALTEKALNGFNNQLRPAVIYAAGLSQSRALGAAIRELQDTWLFRREQFVRAMTCFALGRIDDPASVPFLLGLLSDSDTQVRRSAAAALGGSSARLDSRSITRLIAQYDRDADRGVKLELVLALGKAQQSSARAFLVDELGRANHELRGHVALALALDGHFGNAEVLLETLQREQEGSVRAALALALALLRAPDAVAPTRALFDSTKDPQLQAWLCLALGLHGPDQENLGESLEALVRQSHDVEVIRSALLALGLLGERARLQQLGAELPEVTGLVARAARAHGLGLVGDRNTLPHLLALIRDETQPGYVRAYAVQALGELADPRDLTPAWRLSSQVQLNLDVGFLFELYRVL